MKDGSPGFPFTRMLSNLMERIFEDRWIAFRVAFHARISALVETASASPVRAQGYSSSSRGYVATFDQSSSSWKIRLALFPEDLMPFSGSLPRCGMMRNGSVYRRPPLEPGTAAIDGGVSQERERENTSDADGAGLLAVGSLRPKTSFAETVNRRSISDTDNDGIFRRDWINEYSQSAFGRRNNHNRREIPSQPGVDWFASEPGLGRVADGVAHRVDRIRALGNGQVPACAAAAFIVLFNRLTGESYDTFRTNRASLRSN